jgi:transposase
MGQAGVFFHEGKDHGRTWAMDSQVFVGIDVSKHSLDGYALPDGSRWHSTQEPGEIDGLVAEICRAQPTLVVLEATGGLEMPVAAALAAAGVPVAVVNPPGA